MIIDELMHSEVILSSLDQSHIDEICSLAYEPAPAPTPTLVRIDSFIEFNVSLVHLLANCTIGKNTYTEIKCHSIISLEDIERVVTTPHCPVRVKAAYVKLLYHSFIDTENETREIFTQAYIWSIFESFIGDMSSIATLSALASDSTTSSSSSSNNKTTTTRPANTKTCRDDPLVAYVMHNVIEVVNGFFTHTQLVYMSLPHVI